MEVAPTWSMVSVVRVLRDTLGMIVVMVSIIASMLKFNINQLTLPYASLDIFENSFAYRGPFIWNALPNNIRKCVTLSCFKIALKAHVLN